MVDYFSDLKECIEKIKDSKDPLIIYFTALWCGPCKKISPYYDQLSKEINKCSFYKVDIDESIDISDYFEIKSMPTFYFFYGGEAIDKFEGADSDRLLNTIKKIFIDINTKKANETELTNDKDIVELANEINNEEASFKAPPINRVEGFADTTQYSFI